MNVIHEHPVGNLGYNFIEPKFIPKNKDEYYLRNIQNKSGLKYKKLTADQMEVLIHNRNTSDNWGNVLVSDKFDEMLVRNCKFFGLVRIGNLSPSYKSFITCVCQLGCTTVPSLVVILAIMCAWKTQII